MSRRDSRQLGFFEDFSLPDLDFSFDFSMPDFDFSLPDISFDTGGYEYIDDFAIDFDMSQFDTGAFDFTMPDLDFDSFLSDDMFADFNFEDVFSDPLDMDFGSLDFVAASDSLPVVTDTPPILDAAGSSGDGLFDSVLKIGKDLFPLVKNAVGAFFTYEKKSSSSGQQYQPRQISSAQAAQIMAMNQAARSGSLSQAQMNAIMAQRQSMGLDTGGLSRYMLPIALGVGGLGLILLLSRNSTGRR